MKAVILTLAPLAFIGFWLGMFWLFARLSGWHTLQERFPDRDAVVRERFRWQSARLGSVSYGSCLRFEVCSTGLRVSVWKLLGPFQRPFFVTWRDLHAVERKVAFLRVIDVQIGSNGAVGTFSFAPRIFERIFADTPVRLG